MVQKILWRPTACNFIKIENEDNDNDNDIFMQNKHCTKN